MKKIIVPFLVVVVAAGLFFGITGCGKEVTKAPTITFDTGDVYVYRDTTVYRNTVFNIRVKAYKGGLNDILNTAKITRSINGGADSALLDMKFYYQSFSQFYSFNAGDSGNINRYTFTVGTEEGQTASSSIAITVN